LCPYRNRELFKDNLRNIKFGLKRFFLFLFYFRAGFVSTAAEQTSAAGAARHEGGDCRGLDVSFLFRRLRFFGWY
jgi:hypothetical protein